MTFRNLRKSIAGYRCKESRWAAELQYNHLEKVVFMTGGVNKVLSDIVRQHPQEFLGFAHHDLCAPNAVEEMQHALDDLGLSGYKWIGPMTTLPKSKHQMVEDMIWQVASSKSVLIVVNIVKRSKKLTRKLSETYPEFDVLILHSQFIARDRAQRERKIVDAPMKILVATQVVEVSLDFDFDVCFTELAPIKSLLQRFGRVNIFPLTCIECFYCPSERDFYLWNMLGKIRTSAQEVKLNYSLQLFWLKFYQNRGKEFYQQTLRACPAQCDKSYAFLHMTVQSIQPDAS